MFLYAIYVVTGNLSEGSFLRNVVVQIPNLTLNLTLTLTRHMGVAEFKSARRWKKNLTRRRAEVQVSRIWFSQVK